MRRQYVRSSVFKSAGYNPEAMVLELEFIASGSVWQYHSFPPAAYERFINSESLGHFFSTEIRDKYPEVQIA